jgi:hypothetical protein
MPAKKAQLYEFNLKGRSRAFRRTRGFAYCVRASPTASHLCARPRACKQSDAGGAPFESAARFWLVAPPL